MSVEAMAWVWKHGPKDPNARLVLLAIADHADDDGRCYPSMIGIASKACVTERGARGIVRRLEADGWLETKVGGGRGGKSQYRVLMVKKPEPVSGNVIPGMEKPEAETGNTKTQNPEAGDTKPGTPVPPNHQGTINNHQQTREARTASASQQNPTDRERLLGAMGIGPDGVAGPIAFLGGQNDMVEAGKWAATGLTLDEQITVIRETCDRQRRKVVGWMPRGFGYFSQPIADFAARKAAPMPQGMAAAGTGDRERQLAFLKKVAGK